MAELTSSEDFNRQGRRAPPLPRRPSGAYQRRRPKVSDARGTGHEDRHASAYRRVERITSSNESPENKYKNQIEQYQKHFPSVEQKHAVEKERGTENPLGANQGRTPKRIKPGTSNEYPAGRQMPGQEEKLKSQNPLAEQKRLLDLAEKTYTLSQETTAGFTKAGLPNSPFYYFAKLYELITKNEIALAEGNLTAGGKNLSLKHPDFLLEFIPIFYGMYKKNLELLMNKEINRVTSRWQTYYQYTIGIDDKDNFDFMRSLTMAVKAHVEGDMSKALAQAFRAFSVKHPEISFNDHDLHNDFFELNRFVFDSTEAELRSHLADISRPLDKRFGRTFDYVTLYIGSTRLGTYLTNKAEDIFRTRAMDINEVYAWRQQAWDDANKIIKAGR
jgi:hypothetical protein